MVAKERLCLCRKCKIVNKTTFGAFVEILPGVKGMVHISEMDLGRVDLESFPDGTEIDVKLLEVSSRAHSASLRVFAGRRRGRAMQAIFRLGQIYSGYPSLTPSPELP